MKVSEIRDIVREHVGRDRLSEPVLQWCIERGLREIEKSGNWYWMEAVKAFNLVVGQQDYSVYTATSGGLFIPNFKDSRTLLYSDQTLTHPTWSEVLGPEQVEVIQLEYADDDDGVPERWTVKEGNTDVTLQVWPPNPDLTYAMQLHHYNWTSLPADVTSSAHEVLLRWPEALIYLATEQAIILATKDLQAGGFWHGMYRQPQMGANDEYTKLHQYHRDRSQPTRVDLIPHGGSIVLPFNGRRDQGY